MKTRLIVNVWAISGLLLLLCHAEASADMITFTPLGGAGNGPVGSSYTEGAYQLTSSSGFSAINFGSSFIGSTSIAGSATGGILLKRTDGQPFKLTSMTLAERNPGFSGFSVNFTGTLYAGGTVSHTAIIDGGAVNPQPTMFSGFQAVTQVVWQQLNPLLHQFDNINLELANIAPPPLPDPPSTIPASSWYSIHNSANGDPTGVAVVNSPFAQVGNLNSPGGKDYRGFARFALDAPELVAATSALLSFVPRFASLNLPVVLEPLFVSGIQESNFQAPAPPGIIFDTSTLTMNQPVTFDVTTFYNYAVENNLELTFRLRQLNEVSDFRQLDWGFDSFKLDLDYEPVVAAVPEPASLSLLSLSAMCVGGTMLRKRRSAIGSRV